jgi:GNAT superfamily N-acetyltransferase
MIKILRINSDNNDFLELVRLLDSDLNLRYGSIQAQYNEYNKIATIDTAVIGYVNQVPAGCGCFKVLSHDTIEVKRMFVKPEFRGSGLAKLLLLEIEKWGMEKGYSGAVLETGIQQPEAIKFYTKLGYLQRENYGQYIGNDNSICMSKKLDK